MRGACKAVKEALTSDKDRKSIFNICDKCTYFSVLCTREFKIKKKPIRQMSFCVNMFFSLSKNKYANSNLRFKKAIYTPDVVLC